MAFREIHVRELSALGDVPVFDVREIDEYTGGHVPGAINIPLSTVPDRIGDFNVGPTVYVICQAGGRSGRACEFLSNQPALASIEFVNIAGGTGGWILEGNDVVLGLDPK